MKNLAFLGSDPNAASGPGWAVIGIVAFTFIGLLILFAVRILWGATKYPANRVSQQKQASGTYSPNYNPPRTTSERVKSFVKICIVLAIIAGVLAGLKGLQIFIQQNMEANAKKKYSECVKKYPQPTNLPNPLEGYVKEYKEAFIKSDFFKYCAPLDPNPSGYKLWLKE